jgi:hypothetical protein
MGEIVRENENSHKIFTHCDSAEENEESMTFLRKKKNAVFHMKAEKNENQ